MSVIEVIEVSKSYHEKLAVSDVSFSLKEQEILGLLGPNGAGKTTLLRMIMGIFYPDRGEIVAFGKPLTPEDKNKIGYLPEERGLYLKQKVLDVLTYLGQLKGMEAAQARQVSLEWLEKLELASRADAPIEQLSKGMQQKVQLIVALLNRPKVLILDEPLSGLDPVNIRLVKNVIRQLHQEGCSVILSTHQMNLVEELCDRVLMIHQGKQVLYGSLEEVRSNQDSNLVLVETSLDLGQLDYVQSVEPISEGKRFRVILEKGVEAKKFLQDLLSKGEVKYFEVFRTPLEDIFIQLVSQSQNDRAGLNNDDSQKGGRDEQD
ncbi:MAG: ATP-binding cassette domain-containing protein [Planctomycetota bacterium]|nr:MAG: ATP-binding cassette domain-containing protein [Planctomycetota bacterium]